MTVLYSTSSVPYIPFAVQSINFTISLPEIRCFKLYVRLAQCYVGEWMYF